MLSMPADRRNKVGEMEKVRNYFIRKFEIGSTDSTRVPVYHALSNYAPYDRQCSTPEGLAQDVAYQYLDEGMRVTNISLFNPSLVDITLKSYSVIYQEANWKRPSENSLSASERQRFVSKLQDIIQPKDEL